MLEITLPKLFDAQLDIYHSEVRFIALLCGRRWGKTIVCAYIACILAIYGHPVGWFAPQYKLLSEAFSAILDILSPLIKTASKTQGFIKLTTGGSIDFWTLQNEMTGRSRRYKMVIIDEAAFAKDNMMEIWERAIKPSLLDYRGRAIVASTPNGINEQNFFYQICTNPKYGFEVFHRPTSSNPFLPKDELDKLQVENDPLVFKQEYLAEFVDWSSSSFFSIDKLYINGSPVSYPAKCDSVYCVIDTAVKGGRENDGTGIVYFSYNKYDILNPITILDWDLIQIDGALLESWMPTVFDRLEQLSRETNARLGYSGAFIEDAAAGSILLQQGNLRGWNTHKIDSKLTMAGKDERAISVSGLFFQEKIKISQYAFDKSVIFKGASRNHLLSQISSFRIGDKEASKRADDLLDCFVYGISIGVGDKYGH